MLAFIFLGYNIFYYTFYKDLTDSQTPPTEVLIQNLTYRLLVIATLTCSFIFLNLKIKKYHKEKSGKILKKMLPFLIIEVIIQSVNFVIDLLEFADNSDLVKYIIIVNVLQP